MRLLLFAFALAGLASAASAAAPSPPLPSPATEAEIASAKAEGDALLRAAHAEDLFDNETGREGRGRAIILRHKASGFVCIFNPGKPQNLVSVHRSLTRGDDVGCTTDTVTDRRERFFTRAPERTPEQQLAEEVKIVQAYDPGAQVYTPPPSKPLFAGPPGMQAPTPVTASLKGGKQGGHRIVVGKVGDWLVIQRSQGGPELGDMGGVIDSSWTITVLEARRHAAQLQSAQGASVRAQSAQPQTQAAPPWPGASGSVTPGDKRAAARAEAEAILSRAHAEAIFENVTAGDLPELRHKLSGFVCTFEPGAADNEVIVYPRQPLGSDVACTTRSDGAINSRFMTRFPMTLNAEQALGVYLAEIKQAHPDAKPASGTFADATVTKPGAAPPLERRTARLTYTMNGEPAFSRVSVAVVKGWVIEQRLTAPMKDAMTIDLMGELMMAADIDRMSGRFDPPRPPGKPI